MNSIQKIVVATDKFRGSLSAYEAAVAVKEGLKGKDVLIRPMADGGEGSLDVVAFAFDEIGREYEKIYIDSVNQKGEELKVPVLIYDGGKSAFIEMATVCGLNLVPKDKRSLLHSTTYGLGEVMRVIIEDNGVRKIVLAIGGSGTNDGGFGMLTALGYRYHNTSVFRNKDIATFIGCIEAIIDDPVETVTPHLKDCEISVICDVKNPLLGKNGATMVYGRQKGGTTDELNQLESALENWAKVVEKYRGQKGLAREEGTGAAGGLGFALKAVLGATLLPGWKTLSDLMHLEDEIRQADMVITGEGKLDRQSFSGKLISGLAEMCRKYDKPLLVVTGRSEVSKSELSEYGVDKVIELSSSTIDGESSFKDAAKIITREVGKLFE